MNDTIHTPEMYRRERILDDWLDRIETGQATAEECLAQHPELRAEMEPMLRAAQRLFAVEVTALSPETVQVIRDQVFARVPVVGKQGASSRRLGLALPWARLAGIAVALVLVLAAALGGAWTISADNLPGSLLYPIKRGAEAAQVAFTHSPADRAYLHVSFALRRVDEGLRLEPSEARWNEQTMAALEELRLAEDSIGQAEKAEVAINWRQIARLGEAGERELADIDLAGPAGRRIADTFRGLQQRARRQLQTGPGADATPETGGTGTPASTPTNADLGSPNGHGKQEDEERGGSGSPQGSTHLRQSTSPTAGPDGKNTAPAREQEKTPRATRTPGHKSSATGASVRVTATPQPTTAPTVEPTTAPTIAPDRGRNHAPQNSDESSGGQQNSGGSSSGGGSGSSGNGGNSSGGSRGGGKK